MLLLNPSRTGKEKLRPFFHDVFAITNGGRFVAGFQEVSPKSHLNPFISSNRRDGRVVDCAGLLNR